MLAADKKDPNDFVDFFNTTIRLTFVFLSHMCLKDDAHAFILLHHLV